MLKGRILRVLRAALRSAKQCPTRFSFSSLPLICFLDESNHREKQLEMRAFVRNTFAYTKQITDEKHALRFVEEGERDVDRMNEFHSYRNSTWKPHKLENTWTAPSTIHPAKPITFNHRSIPEVLSLFI
jgi:hypothetical protein